MKRVLVFAGGLTSSFICFNAIDKAFSWSSDDGERFSRGKLLVQARSPSVEAASKRESLVCFCLFLDLSLYCGKLNLYGATPPNHRGNPGMLNNA